MGNYISMFNSGTEFENFLLSLDPLGISKDYFGNEAPAGYAFCDGHAISKATYPKLFEKIGYTYGGSGDDYNLPDLREHVTVGYKSDSLYFNQIGKKIGKPTHILQELEMPEHSHHQFVTSNSGGDAVRSDFSGDSGGYAGYLQGIKTGDAGGGRPHNNIQPSFVCHKIMRLA